MLTELFTSVSGPASNPCTTTLLPQLLPDSKGMRAAATVVTPGIAAS
jgi:hypothetical protein